MSNSRNSEDNNNTFETEEREQSSSPEDKPAHTMNLAHRRFDPTVKNSEHELEYGHENVASQGTDESDIKNSLPSDDLIPEDDESATEQDYAVEQYFRDEEKGVDTQEEQAESEAGAAQEKVSSHDSEARVESTKISEQPTDEVIDDSNEGSRVRSRQRLKEAEVGDTEVEEEENTRENRRKTAKEEKKKLKIRLVPIWLRLLILIILCAGALSAGAMIGYGVIGKGNPMDVFHVDTWKHIKDIVIEGT